MEYNGTDKRYNQFSEHLKNKFGAKVYKITLDAGFSCPNRDGTISNSGCIFCDDGMELFVESFGGFRYCSSSFSRLLDTFAFNTTISFFNSSTT